MFNLLKIPFQIIYGKIDNYWYIIGCIHFMKGGALMDKTLEDLQKEMIVEVKKDSLFYSLVPLSFYFSP